MMTRVFQEVVEEAVPYLREALEDARGETKDQILELLFYWTDDPNPENLLVELMRLSLIQSE